MLSSSARRLSARSLSPRGIFPALLTPRRRLAAAAALKTSEARTIEADRAAAAAAAADANEVTYPRVFTGDAAFDAVYALAIDELRLNAVETIRDANFCHGAPLQVSCYQTGQLWPYVWTRDISYSAFLSLAFLDPQRTRRSLEFKTSQWKAGVSKGLEHLSPQILQDTGSGGSYPVSTDRVVWALAADSVLKCLPAAERAEFAKLAHPCVRNTVLYDRRVIYDAEDGLYFGEKSFLDWREQTYPAWTKGDCVPITISKSLSTNVLHYIALRVAAASVRADPHPDAAAPAAAPFAQWADDLRSSIRRHFWSPEEGLLRALKLHQRDSHSAVVPRKFELLGQALAVLFDILDEDEARRAVAHYPHAPAGPPVIWPQQPDAHVYHNRAVWPFVTALWLKAAAKVGNGAVVDFCLQSLTAGARQHVSHMENLEFLTANIRDSPINSPRQLWSVAGHVGAVLDVVFGLETTPYGGIRFWPFLTRKMAAQLFDQAASIACEDVSFQDRRINVTLHVAEPPSPRGTRKPLADGVDPHERLVVARVTVNGREIGGDFMAAQQLHGERVNDWHVFLQPQRSSEAATATAAAGANHITLAYPELHAQSRSASADEAVDAAVPVHMRDAPREPVILAALLGPSRQPELADATVVRLEWQHAPCGEDDVVYEVFRNGAPVACDVAGCEWEDTEVDHLRHQTYCYVVTAKSRHSGFHSYPSVAAYVAAGHGRYGDGVEISIGAEQFRHCAGGELRKPADGSGAADGNDSPAHVAAWGAPEHVIEADVCVPCGGEYALQVRYANGGRVNTGITCAVKRGEFVDAASGAVVGGGFLFMPHAGEWATWALSSAVAARLERGHTYTVRIFENEYARNMSYFEHFGAYTGGAGGGSEPHNYVSIAEVKIAAVRLDRSCPSTPRP